MWFSVVGENKLYYYFNYIYIVIIISIIPYKVLLLNIRSSSTTKEEEENNTKNSSANRGQIEHSMRTITFQGHTIKVRNAQTTSLYQLESDDVR